MGVWLYTASDSQSVTAQPRPASPPSDASTSVHPDLLGLGRPGLDPACSAPRPSHPPLPGCPHPDPAPLSRRSAPFPPTQTLTPSHTHAMSWQSGRSRRRRSGTRSSGCWCSSRSVCTLTPTTWSTTSTGCSAPRLLRSHRSSTSRAGWRGGGGGGGGGGLDHCQPRQTTRTCPAPGGLPPSPVLSSPSAVLASRPASPPTHAPPQVPRSGPSGRRGGCWRGPVPDAVSARTVRVPREP